MLAAVADQTSLPIASELVHQWMHDAVECFGGVIRGPFSEHMPGQDPSVDASAPVQNARAECLDQRIDRRGTWLLQDVRKMVIVDHIGAVFGHSGGHSAFARCYATGQRDAHASPPVDGLHDASFSHAWDMYRAYTEGGAMRVCT